MRAVIQREYPALASLYMLKVKSTLNSGEPRAILVAALLTQSCHSQARWHGLWQLAVDPPIDCPSAIERFKPTIQLGVSHPGGVCEMSERIREWEASVELEEPF